MRVHQSSPVFSAVLAVTLVLSPAACSSSKTASQTATAAIPIADQVAPQPGETVVVPSIADKFYNTIFDDVLKQKGASTILMVGTRSTGAVLYTAFGANARGYTVAVAVDGISGSIPVEN